MACEGTLSLYTNLFGRPTGEFRLSCGGDCPGGGTCRTVREVLGSSTTAFCSCGEATGVIYPPGECSIRLALDRRADGTVSIRKQCSYRPCGAGEECRECRVVRQGKRRPTALWRGWVPRIRLVDVFRCECVPLEHPAGLADFYARFICKLVEFALANGITLARDDLYHCHLILDVEPPSEPLDHQGLPATDEAFMIEHCQGFVGHAHESDNKRSKDADNFNVYVDPQGKVRFAGSLRPVDRQNPAGLPGVFTAEQVHFRFCGADEACPPCVTKVFCPALDRHLCVGLRRYFPAGDPALG